MESPDKYEEASKIQKQLLENGDKVLADLMGISLEEFREIRATQTTDLDGSIKVYWSADADSGIVAKIKGKQAVDDDHVTISQDQSQLGDGY